MNSIVVQVTQDTTYCDLRMAASKDGSQGTLQLSSNAVVTIQDDIDDDTRSSLVVESLDESGEIRFLGNVIASPDNAANQPRFLVPVVFAKDGDQSIQGDQITFEKSLTKENSGSLTITGYSKLTLKSSVNVNGPGDLTLSSKECEVADSVTVTDGDIHVTGDLKYVNIAPAQFHAGGNITFNGKFDQPTSTFPVYVSCSGELCLFGRAEVKGMLNLTSTEDQIKILSSGILAAPTGGIAMHAKLGIAFHGNAQALNANEVSIVGSISKVNTDILILGSNEASTSSVQVDGNIVLPGPLQTPSSLTVTGNIEVDSISMTNSQSQLTVFGDFTVKSVDTGSVVAADVVFTGTENQILSVSATVRFAKLMTFSRGSLTIVGVGTSNVRLEKGIEGDGNLTFCGLEIIIVGSIDIAGSLSVGLSGKQTGFLRFESSLSFMSAAHIYSYIDVTFVGQGGITPGTRAGTFQGSSIFEQVSGTLQGASIDINYDRVSTGIINTLTGPLTIEAVFFDANKPLDCFGVTIKAQTSANIYDALTVKGALVINTTELNVVGNILITNNGDFLLFAPSSHLMGIDIGTGNFVGEVSNVTFGGSVMASTGSLTISPPDTAAADNIWFLDRVELDSLHIEAFVVSTQSIIARNIFFVTTDTVLGNEVVVKNGGFLNISATSIKILGSVTSGGELLFIASDSFTCSADIGSSLCTGITLPTCDIDISRGSPLSINAGSGTLLVQSSINAVVPELTLQGNIISLADKVVVSGNLQIVAAMEVNAELLIASAGKVTVRANTAHLGGNITGEGIDLVKGNSDSTFYLKPPYPFMLNANSLALMSSVLLINSDDNNPSDLVECIASTFTFDEVRLSINFKLSHTGSAAKLVSLQKHITAPQFLMDAGAVLVLTGSGNHIITADSMPHFGARKDLPGDLTLAILDLLVIDQSINLNDGTLSVTMSPTSEITVTSTAVLFQATSINIPYVMHVEGSGEKQFYASSSLMLNAIVGASPLRLQGNMITIAGNVTVHTLSVFGNCYLGELSYFINVHTGYLSFDNTLTLQGNQSQALISAKQYFSANHVVKEFGDLEIRVDTPGQYAQINHLLQVPNGALMVNSPLTKLANHVNAASAYFAGSVQVTGSQFTSSVQISTTVGELRFLEQVTTTADVDSGLFLTAGTSVLIDKEMSCDAATTLHVLSPLVFTGINMYASSIVFSDDVFFHNSRQTNVNAANGQIVFKALIQGRDARVQMASLSGVVFESNVNMLDSQLSIIGGACTLYGNIQANYPIESTEVNLLGCREQTMSAFKLGAGNVRKTNGDLVISGKLDLDNGDLLVTGSLTAQDITLAVGDIIAGQNISLLGDVIMKSPGDQKVRAGQYLFINHLNKDALDVYLAGTQIQLIGSTYPIISASAGNVFFCGNLASCSSGTTSPCVDVKQGLPSGGQLLVSPCLSSFSSPPVNDMFACLPSSTGGDIPTTSDGGDMSITGTSDGETIVSTGEPQSSITSTTTSTSNLSGDCTLGTPNCPCQEGKCSSGFYCVPAKDICQEVLELSSQTIMSSYESIAPTKATMNSGEELGTTPSISWSMLTLVYVFVI